MCNGSLMSWMAAVVVLASWAGTAPVAAQNPLEWLSGDWTEPAKRRSKGATGPLATLRIEVAAGMLRILENGAAGEDVRCRLDGTELQYRQTRPQATVDYTLTCELGPRSVAVSGAFTVGATEGFPPREFEIRKTYELAKDGSLRTHDQLWGIIPGLGRAALSDTTTRFSRNR